MNIPDSLQKIGHDACILGAELMKNKNKSMHEFTAKGAKDYATEVDYQIEREICAFLLKQTPDIPFMGEEFGGADLSDERYWVLDPIDGTVNYASNMPMCSVALALVEQDVAVYASILFPFLDEMYTAAKGQGAWCNGSKQLHVSKTETIDNAVISFGDFAVGKDAGQRNIDMLKIFTTLATKSMRMRMYGCASYDLAMVASGRIDATVALANLPWDYQAGSLLVREAGGVVTDRNGKRHNARSYSTIAANKNINAQIVSLT